MGTAKENFIQLLNDCNVVSLDILPSIQDTSGRDVPFTHVGAEQVALATTFHFLKASRTESQSVATFDSATLSVFLNPFHNTAWNVRKQQLMLQVQALLCTTDSARTGRIHTLICKELAFNSLVLQRCPKSQEAWSHRWWVVHVAYAHAVPLSTAHEGAPPPPPPTQESEGAASLLGTGSLPWLLYLLAQELRAVPALPAPPSFPWCGLPGLCARCSEPPAGRPRCYTAWTHRGKVCALLAELARKYEGLRADTLTALRGELLGPGSTEARVRTVPSDYSAWHHRGRVLALLTGLHGPGGSSRDLLHGELTLLSSVSDTHGLGSVNAAERVKSDDGSGRTAVRYHQRVVETLLQQLAPAAPSHPPTTATSSS